MTDTEEALSRDEVLAGLVARRAATAVFAIEARAAQLALSDRHVVAPPICEGMVATAERDWLAAVAAGGSLPEPVRPQHLERAAAGWAHLVPDNHGTRAEVAHRLLTRHRARRGDLPRMRAALGLDDPAVQQAHRRRHGGTVEDLFVDRLGMLERLRWAASRVGAWFDDLSPAWAAFALTLTQTVGAGILALPIALATLGPLPGLALVVVLGLVNVVTAAAMAEAFARTGSVRWGGAFLAGVVDEHLGRASQVVLTVAFVGFTVVALSAYYVGLGTTLEAATGVPTAAWAALLFAVTVAFTLRGRLGATVVSALGVGAVNLAIIVVLATVAILHLDTANLAHAQVPLVGGRPLDGEVLGLVFGVVLLAFFGHTAVASGARGILQRDPSGRSLVRGTVAAMLASTGVYGAWVVTVGGAVTPERLAGEAGTALAPLAEVAGPFVLVVGTVFVVTSMGMAAVHFSLGLHHQVTDLVDHRAARWIALVPLLAVFLVVEAMVLADRASFTASLAAVGTLAGPLLAGVFPVLLVLAARRRGGYVARGVPRGLDTTRLPVAVLVLFVMALLAHGLVVWEGPLRRGTALAVGVLAVGLAARALRSGRFAPLTVLEVRRDRDLGLDRVRLTSVGRAATAQVETTAPDDTRRRLDLDGSVRLPERTTRVAIWPLPATIPWLRIWAHEITPIGATVPLDVVVHLGGPDGLRPVALHHGTGTAPVSGNDGGVTIDLQPVRRRPGAAA